MKISKKLIVGMLVLMPSIAMSAGWSSFGKITGVTSNAATGSIWISMNKTPINDGCTYNNPYILPGSSSPGFNRLYSAILTAKSMGTNVRVYISGCSSNTARITNIQLQ